jgi:hypothetical protein
VSTKTDTQLYESDLRMLLEMYSTIDAEDPDEYEAGKPYSLLLLGPEIVALKKALANALVGR